MQAYGYRWLVNMGLYIHLKFEIEEILFPAGHNEVVQVGFLLVIVADRIA